METETVKEFADSLKNVLFRLGGGLPCDKENREILKNIGTVVYLKHPRRSCVKGLAEEYKAAS